MENKKKAIRIDVRAQKRQQKQRLLDEYEYVMEQKRLQLQQENEDLERLKMQNKSDNDENTKEQEQGDITSSDTDSEIVFTDKKVLEAMAKNKRKSANKAQSTCNIQCKVKNRDKFKKKRFKSKPQKNKK